MFSNNDYETRVAEWVKCRRLIELSKSPIDFAISVYENVEQNSLQYDPWDKKSWPTPWELIYANKYCAFTRILGIIYSLKLTKMFSHSQFFLLICQNTVIGNIEFAFELDKKCYLYNSNHEILTKISVE